MEGHNYILGVAGRKGSGKSTWVRERIREIERLAIIDTLGEYADLIPTITGTISGMEHLGPHGAAVYVLASVKPEDKFQFSFMLPPNFTSEVFNGLSRAAYMAGNLTLVIEEIDYFSKPTWNEPGLDLLIRYGRHRNVNLIYTVRNLVETSRRLTSQTDVFVFFSIDEPRYLDEIENRLGPETATAVSMLGEHEFTIVNKGKQ